MKILFFSSCELRRFIKGGAVWLLNWSMFQAQFNNGIRPRDNCCYPFLFMSHHAFGRLLSIFLYPKKKKNQIQYSGVLISISLKKLKQDHFNSVEQIWNNGWYSHSEFLWEREKQGREFECWGKQWKAVQVELTLWSNKKMPQVGHFN